jgi:hypothetical protein
MCILLIITPAVALMVSLVADTSSGDRTPDLVVELIKKGETLEFIEHGQKSAKTVTAVVGQTLRIENQDTKAHTFVGDLGVPEKQVFKTMSIQPRGHEDILLDVELYRRAEGRPANLAKIKIRCDGQAAPATELQLLSAARRNLR